MKEVVVGNVHIGGQNPLVLIAGPCVIETEEGCFDTAMALRDVAQECGVPLIFKTSYDKANRFSVDSYRGPGVERGLKVLRRIRQELVLPVLTDVHSPEEAEISDCSKSVRCSSKGKATKPRGKFHRRRRLTWVW